MNKGDMIKVTKFLKPVTDEQEKALLNKCFVVEKVRYEGWIQVRTEIGLLDVYEGEYEVLVSLSEYLNKIDELETEVARLQSELEDITEHRDQLMDDLHNITRGF